MVQTIRMIEIENCAVTRIFRKEMVLPPTLKRPFNTCTGLNDDMKSAG
jgi:hypothetical protein